MTKTQITIQTTLITTINKLICRSNWVEEFTLNLVKDALFTINGECKKSGNCCKSIMLYDNQKPIDTLKQWVHFLKKNPKYQSFTPHPNENKIISFNCTSLTSNNTCSQYDSRPTICRQYPTSFFFQHGFIHDSCGYFITQSKKKTQWLFPNVKCKINQFLSNKYH